MFIKQDVDRDGNLSAEKIDGAVDALMKLGENKDVNDCWLDTLHSQQTRHIKTEGTMLRQRLLGMTLCASC